jgi:hypothetical protein
MSNEDLETRIRERAYLLWVDAGKPEGGADAFWHRAKEMMEDEGKSAYPPAQSQGNRS